MTRNLIGAIVLTFCVAAFAFAQQSTSSPVQSHFALEVATSRGQPPIFQPIYHKHKKTRGSTYGRFDRIAGWQSPTGVEPVDGVELVPRLDNETVVLEVSVPRRERLHWARDFVGTYTLRENEELSVKRLENFGVTPFHVKVVRVVPITSNLPEIINKTKSVEVLGLEPLVTTFPRYKLSVQNLDRRDVALLRINIVAEGRTRACSAPRSTDGQPLIKAGETADIIQMRPVRAEARAAGFNPTTPSAQQIVITAVVFEDGTYEGDEQAAVSFRALSLGDKRGLERAIPALEQAVTNIDSADVVDRLLQAIGSLNDDVNSEDVEALRKQFPHVEREFLKLGMGTAIYRVKNGLMESIKSCSTTTTAQRSKCLTGIKDHHVLWLARLNGKVDPALVTQ